ncbi:hypothetical protein N9R54_01305 [Pelobium sp.]|nr:HipA family kinase [Pelobium sp.]MDA9554847.1 hypothetical protein [Pelobium sp.]
MTPYLHSIAAVTKAIETNGSRPVIALAEDLEFYACKYDSPAKLINEYLAHAFLKIWEIPVLEAAFVHIQQDHISAEIISNRTQPYHFEKPSFGLKYDDHISDVNNVLLGLKGSYTELQKYSNKLDLLKIGLFDLWVANTDRNHNNYNLVLQSEQQQFRFIPIDHSDIFDGCSLGKRPLAQLTEEDSVLSSEIAGLYLFPKSKIITEANLLLQKFPTFVADCGKLLTPIVAEIPELWCTDRVLLSAQVEEAVISNHAWLAETEQNFRMLIELNFH